MSHCQSPESNLPLESFIWGCGMLAVCAAAPALPVPFAFIYAVSVNIPQPQMTYRIPLKLLSGKLNPVPIAFPGQQRNRNLNSLPAKSPADSVAGPAASDQFHFL